MTALHTPTILLIGFKGSGKTTFLAALWHLLEAQEVPSALRTPALQPDREHLNAIRRQWMELKPMGRTGLQQPQTVAVNVEDRNSGRLASVIFPDISGEVFRIQWEEREVLTEYAELERHASGAVLFVHPDGVTPSPRIPASARAHAEQAGDVSWNPKSASTQVQLVDVLQNYLRLSEVRPVRLAVVVSAWDLLNSEVINPETWIEARLPLVAQFLQVRRGEIETRSFGVSAQGGDLERDRLALEKHLRASERAFVVEEGRRHADLTEVVKWALPKDDDEQHV